MAIADHQHHTGIAVKQSDHHERFTLCSCADRMLVESGYRIDRTAHQRGDSFGTSAQIGNVDRQAFVFEESKLIRECERQIDKLRLAPDGHLNSGWVARARTCRKEQAQKCTKDTKA